MTLVTVFHQNKRDYFADLLGLDMPTDDMRKVAWFHTDLPRRQALEEAVRLTSHQGAPWPLRKDIHAEPGTHRSTLVGDVVVFEKQAFQMVEQGWKRLNKFAAG